MSDMPKRINAYSNGSWCEYDPRNNHSPYVRADLYDIALRGVEVNKDKSNQWFKQLTTALSQRDKLADALRNVMRRQKLSDAVQVARAALEDGDE